MAENKPQTINEEAGLPENWVPIDKPPVNPSRDYTAQNDGSQKFLQGSLPPGYQHDSSFVGTEYKSGQTPNLSLMPLGLSGNPTTNAAIQSTAVKATSSSPAPAVEDIESIAVNKQTVTNYDVVLGDRNTLDTFSNNAGGTIVLPGPTTGAFAFRQVVSGSTQDSPPDVTSILHLNINPLQGSLLVMQMSNTSGGGNVPQTVVDNNGNTWHLIGGHVDGGNLVMNVYYAFNVNAGPTNIKITNFYGSTNGVFGNVCEYVGFGTVDPFDTFDIHSSATASVTTGKNDCLVYSAIRFPNPSFPSNIAGFTARLGSTNSLVQDQFVPLSGTTILSDSFPTVVSNGAVDFVASFATSAGPSAALFPAGWFCYIENTGTGIFNLTSTAQIDNSLLPVAIGPNEGLLVVYDGTNWFTMRGIGNSSSTTAFLVEINGVGVSTDRKFFINGVTDGASVWSVNINGVPDGG